MPLWTIASGRIVEKEFGGVSFSATCFGAKDDPWRDMPAGQAAR
jgi:hypothetical protein